MAKAMNQLKSEIGTGDKMKKVFICSPYAGASDAMTMKHIQYARDLCKYAFRMNFAPFASHLIYPQFLDDKIPSQRVQGMNAGQVFMSVCDEFWIGIKYQISSGMKDDIDSGKLLHIPMYFIVETGQGQFSKHKA